MKMEGEEQEMEKESGGLPILLVYIMYLSVHEHLHTYSL